MLHTPRQLVNFELAGTTSSDVARGYIGIVLNSNFSRGFGSLEASSSRAKTLGRFCTFRELASAMRFRLAEGIRIKIRARG